MRLSLVIFAVLAVGSVQSANIFGLFNTFSASHYVLAVPLLKELSNSGHNLTIVTLCPTGYKSATYHEVVPTLDPVIYELVEDFKRKTMENTEGSQLTMMWNTTEFGKNVNIAIHGSPEIQSLLQTSIHFDLMITEVVGPEALLGFATHFDVPVVGISTIRANPWVSATTGSPAPTSFVPFLMLDLPKHMSFLQRVQNTIVTWVVEGIRIFLLDSAQEKAYNEIWPDPKPAYREFKSSLFSLVLMNSHLSVDGPQPLLTNIIEVGGMQVNTKSKSLPADIQKFMDEASEGVVLFSLGSNLEASFIEPDKREAIVKVLAGIKQKVILKWDHPESITHVPKGKFFVSKWLPQSDLLAHKNLRLFVTHGGLGGLTETIYHGKPVVAVPIFADQLANAKMAKTFGIGIQLLYTNLTESSFSWALNEVLENPQYSETASELSLRYRDRPQNSLELAKFWVEYAIRHKGAPFLKSPAQKLTFFQYYSLDVYGLLLLVILTVLFVTKKLLGLIFRTISKSFRGSGKRKVE